jgi:uncharacterized small protein (DUF1192 family)
MMKPDAGTTAAEDATLAATVARLAADVADLRDEVARLDADLDEARRLNLRAAELLDTVYEHLGGEHPGRVSGGR